jgi:pimeloyl-ACP methyl ester carboxylesterase
MGKLVALVLVSLALARAAHAEEKNLQLHDGGLVLNAHLTLADGKSLKDGAVLLTHGTLAHNGMHLIQVLQKELAAQGVNSLAPTLGYGLSNRQGMFECNLPHRHKYEDALHEIGLWLSWLKSNGADKVALMGHSRGGAQTAWFAAGREDAAISKVILLAPSRWSSNLMREQYKARFGSDLDAQLAKAQSLPKGTMMEGVDFIACPKATVRREAFLSYYADEPRFDTPTLLAKVKVPVLVIAAADDQVVKGLPDAVQPMADGKNISLAVIPDADHYFNNFAAEDAAQAAAAFLKD